MIAIDCNSLLIFEEKWLNYASGPKSAPDSDSLWVRRIWNVCVQVICAPNETILLVYIPAKIRMSFISKDDFFAKIGIFCKSIAGPLSEANTHWIVNWINSWTNWTLYGVIPRSLCKIRPNDVALRNKH